MVLLAEREAVTVCGRSAAGFESMDTVPRMFVLMGNFQSYSATSATTDYDAVRQNFTALAGVLQRHKRLVVRTLAGTAARLNFRHHGSCGAAAC